MNKLIILLLLITLSSCHNYAHSNSVISNYETKEGIKDNLYLYKQKNLNEFDNDKKLLLNARLEALLLDSSFIMPLSISSNKRYTRLLNNFNNYYIHKGSCYYKLMDCMVSENKVSKELYNNYLSNNNLNIDIKNSFSTYFEDIELQTLDFAMACDHVSKYISYQINDSLLKYDKNGNVKCNLCNDYSISDDRLTYTFTLKDDIFFVDNNNNIHSKITAYDFKNGFIHMLDTQKYTGLFDDVLNVKKYLDEKVSYDEIGVKVIDEKTLSFTLNSVNSMFLNILANSNFAPINLEFFTLKGGALGIKEFDRAKRVNSYCYGNPNNLNSILYTGAYTLTNIDKNLIELNRNMLYCNENIKIDNVKLYKDNDNNMILEKFNDGTYDEIIIDNDDDFAIEKHYDCLISCFGFNLNRNCYEIKDSPIKSNKTELEINVSSRALNNIYFRKAITSAIDKSKITSSINYNRISMFSPYLENDTYDNDNKIFLKNTTYDNILNYYLKSKTNSAIYYYNKAYKMDREVFSNEIKLDILCFAKDENQVSKAKLIKENIECLLDNVKINIINVDNPYHYFIAGNECHRCYDIYFDYSLKANYNSQFSFLENAIDNI